MHYPQIWNKIHNFEEKKRNFLQKKGLPDSPIIENEGQKKLCFFELTMACRFCKKNKYNILVSGASFLIYRRL